MRHRLGDLVGAPRICLGLSWDDGGVECDLVALVLGEDGRVLGDPGFVYFNNLSTPGASVILRQPAHPPPGVPHRAQLFVDLCEAGPQVGRVKVGFATVQAGANLTPVRNLRLQLFGTATGDVLVQEELPGIVHTSCLVIGDLARDHDGWYLEVTRESRTDGLAGLARALGVNLAAD